MLNKKIKQSYISVEGNIGAGKSTFLKKIAPHCSLKTILEPHEAWQNVNHSGENILDAFYKDTSRWAYSFQTYVFLTRLQELERGMAAAPTQKLFIAERSVIADRYTFSLMCHEAGKISTLEWNMYVSWYDWLTNLLPIIPMGIIYLQTTPEKAFERINIRNRQEEQSISLEYLSQLHEKHENWLIYKRFLSHTIKDIPVLVLDCNEDFAHNQLLWKKHSHEVEIFIDTISKHNDLTNFSHNHNQEDIW